MQRIATKPRCHEAETDSAMIVVRWPVHPRGVESVRRGLLRISQVLLFLVAITASEVSAQDSRPAPRPAQETKATSPAGDTVDLGKGPGQSSRETNEAARPAEPMAPKETSAPRLVREGNRLLLNEKPAEALEAYQKAETLKPDAREIAFGEGLAHYRLGEYDKARDAFNRAGGGAADVLADDALYSLGTCDHAEALGAEDPKVAMSKLESAMRSYQSVLADQSDHPAAKDANLKAASYWRQLKQQMQQQQQQQQNSDQKNDEQKDEQQQQNQQQQQDQEKQEQQEQKQQQEQQQENQQKNEQDQKQGEKEQQQSSEAKEDDKQQDEPKQAQQEKEENVSREQAERKLRELMQDLRDRNKRRREEVKSPPYRPTEKDW